MVNNKIKKIGLVVASQGYQPTEYGLPKEILSNNGIKVITISDQPTIAIAKDNSTTDVDITLSQVIALDFDGIFLIGGPGALEHLNTPKMHEILQQMEVLNKPYGAICISPRILAEANVLNYKKATGWDEDLKLDSIFKKHNVKYEKNKPVVIDGNVITATGPDAAEEFGLSILRLLNS